MSGQLGIRLLLADVDGTLVPKDKVLTEATKEVVRELRRAGIFFAITSGRPPRGMRMLIEPLDLQCAIADFDGGVLSILTFLSSKATHSILRRPRRP